MSKGKGKQVEAEATQAEATQVEATDVPVVKAKKSTRKTEAQLLVAYPHVIPGTLRLEVEGKWAGKQTVEATLDCGHVERLATSDLFQVKRCHECKHPAKKQTKASPKGEAEAEGVTSANYPGKSQTYGQMPSEEARAIARSNQ